VSACTEAAVTDDTVAQSAPTPRSHAPVKEKAAVVLLARKVHQQVPLLQALGTPGVGGTSAHAHARVR
jgi:hypothetical protein